MLRELKPVTIIVGFHIYCEDNDFGGLFTNILNLEEFHIFFNAYFNKDWTYVTKGYSEYALKYKITNVKITSISMTAYDVNDKNKINGGRICLNNDESNRFSYIEVNPNDVNYAEVGKLEKVLQLFDSKLTFNKIIREPQTIDLVPNITYSFDVISLDKVTNFKLSFNKLNDFLQFLQALKDNNYDSIASNYCYINPQDIQEIQTNYFAMNGFSKTDSIEGELQIGFGNINSYLKVNLDFIPNPYKDKVNQILEIINS